MARSYLYVPGDQEDKLRKARDRDADAVIIDLEDSVAPSEKGKARSLLARYAEGAWVRINSDDQMTDDLEAIGGLNIPGVFVAKVHTPAILNNVPGVLVPLIESAAGLLAVTEIARAERVAFLGIGEVDLTSEIGMTPSDDFQELLPIRTAVVVASVAAGIDPPLGPVFLNLDDADGLRESSQALKRLGFRSRSAIHPAQVPIINEVFTPTSDEVERARRLVDQFEAAGSGAAADDGRMIDEAVVKAARRILREAAL